MFWEEEEEKCVRNQRCLRCWPPLCFSGLLSCPRLPANRPYCHWISHSSFMLFLVFSLSLSLEQVVIRSEPTPTPLSKPFPPPSVFVLSGDLAPSHQSIRFTEVPPGFFWRCFHLIISLKRFFFSGQYEVTDHIRAAFRLSDHLIKPRSISPPLFSDHLFFLGLRGEAHGLGPPNRIPTKALEVDWVTYTNSQGFRAWLSVPYSLVASPEILAWNACPWPYQIQSYTKCSV